MTTIADVARHAGVSASTVSYVLSGKRTISAGTRSRVLASVRALGYHPHAGARALASHRAGVLGLALPLRAGTEQPVVLQFADGVVTAAREAGLDVLLLTADEGPAALRRIAGSAMVDGLILLLPAPADPPGGEPLATRPPDAGTPDTQTRGRGLPDVTPRGFGPAESQRPEPAPAGPDAPDCLLTTARPPELGLPRVSLGLPASAGRALGEGRRAVSVLLDRLGTSH